MDGKWNVSKKQTIYLSIFVLLFGILLAYVIICNGTNVSINDGTIQRIENDNKQAREQIGTASREIGNAESGLDDAAAGIDRSTESINKVKESISGNERELDECQRIVAESRADISRAGEILDGLEPAN